MSSELLTEAQFKLEFCKWLLKNDRCAFLKDDMTVQDYADGYRLPDFDYVHVDSFCNSDGDVVTMLKSEFHLRAWETKNGREPKAFTFCHFLKTFIDNPEAEPYPLGYMIDPYMK